MTWTRRKRSFVFLRLAWFIAPEKQRVADKRNNWDEEEGGWGEWTLLLSSDPYFTVDSDIIQASPSRVFLSTNMSASAIFILDLKGKVSLRLLVVVAGREVDIFLTAKHLLWEKDFFLPMWRSEMSRNYIFNGVLLQFWPEMPYFSDQMGQTWPVDVPWNPHVSSQEEKLNWPNLFHWCAAHRRLVRVQPCSPHCFWCVPCQSDKLYFRFRSELELTHGMSLETTVDMSKEYLGVESRFWKRQSYLRHLKT